MTGLPRAFLDIPFAHRGLHGPGLPENSVAAAQAAIAAGYGIELDIQPAYDGTPMVFHDYDLQRMTGRPGRVAEALAAELGAMQLLGTDQGIPSLRQFLDMIDGQVPLLIELKDQAGDLGAGIGQLHVAVADCLAGYTGQVAVMSFNPHMIGAFQGLMPYIPVGLTTCGFGADDWPDVRAGRRAELAAITDYGRVGATFISHDIADLENPRVAELAANGAGILCWTVRTPQQEAAARQTAANITFEGYLASRADRDMVETGTA